MDDTLLMNGGELRLRAKLTPEQFDEVRAAFRAASAVKLPKPDRVRRQPLPDIDEADVRKALAKADQQMEQIEADAIRREDVLRQTPDAPPDEAAVATAAAKLRQALAAAVADGIRVTLGKPKPVG